MARKIAAGNHKKLGTAKVSKSAFANFDDESSEEEEPAAALDGTGDGGSLSASGVTRADLASLALEETLDAKKSGKAAPAAAAASKKAGRPVISSRLAYVDPDEDAKAKSAQRELTIATGSRGYNDEKPKYQPKQSSYSSASSSTYEARERFSDAKAISSSQFFNENDSSNRAESDARLQQFHGSNSISSSQYFGEPERSGGGGDFDADLGDLGQVKENEKKNDLCNQKL